MVELSVVVVAIFIALGVGYWLGRVSQRSLNHLLSTVDESQSPHFGHLMEAMAFSSEKHKHQRRKNASKTPYICHPIRVARYLAVEGAVTDLDVLIGALLHDTVEDTGTTFLEIERKFGTRVTEIVRDVTDDKSLPKQKRKQLQVEHAPLISAEAKLVKLADKLDNLTDLLTSTPVGWKADRVSEYFEWAERVVHGLRGVNTSLEMKIDQVLSRKQEAIANIS